MRKPSCWQMCNYARLCKTSLVDCCLSTKASRLEREEKGRTKTIRKVHRIIGLDSIHGTYMLHDTEYSQAQRELHKQSRTESRSKTIWIKLRVDLTKRVKKRFSLKPSNPSKRKNKRPTKWSNRSLKTSLLTQAQAPAVQAPARLHSCHSLQLQTCNSSSLHWPTYRLH